jgi:ABC-type multidrug transport system ATPase subunit
VLGVREVGQQGRQLAAVARGIGGGDANLGLHEVETPFPEGVARRGMGVLLGGSNVYDSSLFGSLSVFENVAHPLRSAGIAAAAADARTWALLHEFGLAEAAERLPAQLSAGERRRVALAKALVADPPLLVLDDPGPAVDALNQDAILRSIDRHRRRSGATCVLITHDVDLGRRLGDRLAVLLGGRIVAVGDPDELLDGVHTADEFDDRFGFSGLFVRATPNRGRGRCPSGPASGPAGGVGLMAVLVAIVVAVSIVIATGVLDNPVL